MIVIKKIRHFIVEEKLKHKGKRGKMKSLLLTPQSPKRKKKNKANETVQKQVREVTVTENSEVERVGFLGV